MTPASPPDAATSRLLIHAPGGRDGQLTQSMLTHASMRAEICDSLGDLAVRLESDGAGALLLAEEALDDSRFAQLEKALDQQPPWSDIPVLMFGGSRGPDATLASIRSIDALRSVTILERPMHASTVLSTVRAALRSRERQYEVRDLLVALHTARAEAETANRLKDEFLATLSHELRTPMNAILGWTAMLSHGQVEPAQMPRIFQALERNAHAQAELISDVLDVSRIINGKLQLTLVVVEACDIMQEALDAIRPAAIAKGVTLTADLVEACYVRGDTDRLRQIYWNLLSNAVKFTPSGGAVSVSIKKRKGQIEILVADTGRGMEAEFLPFVFDRFRQADQSTTRTDGGLGLGLALVKNLVELHGGSVQVTSDGVDHGSVFRVSLPEVMPAPADLTTLDEAGAPAPTRAFDGRRVLVVEDDATTRDLLASVLGSTGADVVVASSVRQALAELDTRAPDIMVAELGMPGEEALIARIRGLTTATAMASIALSTFPDPQSRQDALLAGFTTCLPKPAQPQDILRTIDKLLLR